MTNLSSGSRAVDAMLSFDFSGNIIMESWFQTIVDDKGRPNLLAINILADIVYWYRPTAVRDEHTGQIVRYKKKFAADRLEKSLKDYADQFNMPKTNIQRAFEVLISLGVVKKEVKQVPCGKSTRDASFVEIVPDVLRQLTFPEESFDADSAVNDDIEEYTTREEDVYCGENTYNYSSNRNVKEPTIYGGVPNRYPPVPNRNPPVPYWNPTKNTKGEYIYNNISNNKSSSSLREMYEGNDDDDEEFIKQRQIEQEIDGLKAATKKAASKKERDESEFEKQIKDHLDYLNAVKLTNAKIADSVIRVLLERDDDFYNIITANAYLDICLDIFSYASRNKITNLFNFAQKCVENYKNNPNSSGGLDITNERGKENANNRNSYEERADYDFAALEKMALGMSHSIDTR